MCQKSQQRQYKLLNLRVEWTRPRVKTSSFQRYSGNSARNRLILLRWCWGLQRRGSMVKKLFPVALGLEDMASPSVYLSHRPEHTTSPGLPRISLFSSCQTFDGGFQFLRPSVLALR